MTDQPTPATPPPPKTSVHDAVSPEEARRRLQQLEDGAVARGRVMDARPQLPLFPAPDHPALAALRDADPDGLSPREAHELLYRLRRLADRD